MAARICGQEARYNHALEKKLEAAGWGLFFVWIGAAIITDIGWGTGLIGVGAIILLGQVARKYLGLKTEKLGILLGSFFVLGGVWRLITIQFSLVPVLCVVAGVALLMSALLGKSRG